MKKIDALDILQIKKDADKMIKINTEIRYGQAIFNAAYNKFPEATNKLRATEYDCFYDDNKVNIFLNQLKLLE